MLHEEPCVQDGIIRVPAPELGAVPTHGSAPGLSKTGTFADRSNPQHPEIRKLSQWLQQPEVPSDANDSDKSDESDKLDRSDGSDGSDRSDMPDESDAPSESEASDGSDELSVNERSEKPWVPPIMTSLDMEFTIDDFAPEPYMSMKEHIMNDGYIEHMYRTFRKTWPSPEDVQNDVDVAATLLVLLVMTTSRKVRLREEWLDVKNLRILAEQELVRKSLAGAVTQKHFAILRTLLIWYQCHTTF
ncbi:hypothetical protein CERSUDRAFT_115955 [Gelatoporia subvermispora B]|uniref:Uncharacterized protein n=1 Tax=Ceriporiopsis subvermispora (strain B) TaxID=914234 RepID=M2QG72_CERS8|nr:hypothetical protein CERSUDRAFT_115955 [Gelatoporia subvermispora B]